MKLEERQLLAVKTGCSNKSACGRMWAENEGGPEWLMVKVGGSQQTGARHDRSPIKQENYVTVRFQPHCTSVLSVLKLQSSSLEATKVIFRVLQRTCACLSHEQMPG